MTKVPVPPSPSVVASEDVRALYARARGGRAPGVRAVILDKRLGLYSATEEGARDGGNLVWTSAPTERAAFTFRVVPRELWIAGDSFLVFSLDDPIHEAVKRHIRVHQFRWARADRVRNRLIADRLFDSGGVLGEHIVEASFSRRLRNR